MGRPRFTAAEKRAASKRMKQYWASRRRGMGAARQAPKPSRAKVNRAVRAVLDLFSP